MFPHDCTNIIKSSSNFARESSIGTCPHAGYIVSSVSATVLSSSNSATCTEQMSKPEDMKAQPNNRLHYYQHFQAIHKQ